MAEYMLTTVDNPYSPVTHYNEWLTWDAQHGYHTPAYLARVTFTSDELSEADQALAIDQAMDEIIEMHNGGLYKKVPVPDAA
jgi:hypothetical protein